ncbi:MAG: tetratricopeptide repeat protein, partial [Candidatus Eremiobacteraeota bacterium]|nr:tetratricopeptide repeat protein [Candidatus Eremiobacteraeota bacterium]
HHWTLERAIDWSYEALTQNEQRLFQRLSIFESPFTLEAVESVCVAAPLHIDDIVDLIGALGDKSFVRHDIDTGRWHVLETMRAYARDRLEEVDRTSLRSLHADYVAEVAQRDHHEASKLARWLNDVEAIVADVRAAANFTMQENPAAALRLAVALRGFWIVRGHYELGYDMLRQAADASRDDASADVARATALTSASTLANKLGRMDDAVRAVEEARALFSSLQDERGLAHATNTLGNIYSSRGDLDEARAHFRTAVELFEHAGDDGAAAMPLANLGIIAMDARAWDEAETQLRESCVRAERTGDARILAWAQGALGELAVTRNDSASARRHYERWVELSRSVGDKASLCTALGHLAELCIQDGSADGCKDLLRESLETASENALLLPLADALETIAQMAFHSGEIANGATLVGASDVLRERMFYGMRDAARERREEILRAAKRRDGIGFADGYAKGRTSNTDSAIELALRLLQPR